MARPTLRFFFVNAFGSLPYTLVISPLCQLILYGSVQLLNSITVVKYLLGYAITCFFPTGTIAAALNRRLFSRARAPFARHSETLCFAFTFELVFSLGINLLLCFVLPGAYHNLRQMFYEMALTYLPSVAADFCITTFLLPGIKRGANRLFDRLQPTARV